MNYDLLGGVNITWLLFAILILWEQLSPHKSLDTIKQRWIANFSFLLISYIIFASLQYGFTNFESFSDESPHLFTSLENIGLVYIVGIVLLLDFFSYILHRVFHNYQILWRCHSTHHSDLNIDVSTNFRHHPFESILSWILTFVLVLVMDLNLIILAFYASTSLIIQMWQHSNINFNHRVDCYISYLLVTPRVHRVHHSSYKAETNSNYGTIFTIWDRALGTFTDPKKTVNPVVYGLEYFQEPSQQTFLAILKQPFRKYSKQG